MRGRKRHRKKDEKRRGIYGLPIRVTPKRGQRDQEVADALAQLIAYKLTTAEFQCSARRTAKIVARKFLIG